MRPREMTGTHDFHAFCASDDEHQGTVRTIHEVALEPDSGSPELLAVRVRGTAFLKNMVRVMVGTLVKVGRGRLDAAGVAALLKPGAARGDAGETAPAYGLTLVEVKLGRRDEKT